MKIQEQFEAMLHHAEEAKSNRFKVLDYSYQEGTIEFGFPLVDETFIFNFTLEDIKSSIDHMEEVEQSYEDMTGEFIIEIYQDRNLDETKTFPMSASEYVDHFGFSELAHQMVYDLAVECCEAYEEKKIGRFLEKCHRLGVAKVLFREMEEKAPVALAA